MTIYFLQKLNPPVLPILHEIISSKKLLDKKLISNKLNKLKKNLAESSISNFSQMEGFVNHECNTNDKTNASNDHDENVK
jgi:3-methyladenine DNA glycosylase AlkC